MISVTLLSSYLYCPRKLYYERVLKIVPFPKEAIVKGTLRHNVYDLINKKEESIVLSINNDDHEFIFDKYRNEYSKILRLIILNNKYSLREVGLELSQTFRDTWPHILHESKRRANNLVKNIDTLKLFGKDLWENLEPKIHSEVNVESSNLELRGIVDSVEYHKDAVIPYELKTGSAPNEGMWPGHRMQIAAYMLLFSKKLGHPIDKGIIRYLDSDEDRVLYSNPFIQDEVLKLRDKVIELLTSKTVPPKCKNENKCKACGLCNRNL